MDANPQIDDDVKINDILTIQPKGLIVTQELAKNRQAGALGHIVNINGDACEVKHRDGTKAIYHQSEFKLYEPH